MKCANCGAVIEADSNFCIVCGKPVSRTASASGTHPGAVYQQPEPARRKASPALLTAIIVLVVAALLLGAYLVFRDQLPGGQGETFSIQAEYTYSIKDGEESGLSVRRSRLETLEDLFAKATAELSIENSLPLAYCLLDVNVGEPQNMQGFGANGGGGKILRSASTIITERELNARQSHIQSQPERLDRIREAELALLQAKSELKAAEVQLALASRGSALAQELTATPENPDLTQVPDSLPQIDNSVDQALRVYDAALGSIEGVYESLNSLKTEAAAAQNATLPGGSVPK
ncbi:MAG: zinc ribbon domain-containing protein [Candidatus Cloacimonetes bacterium]|nr:zinc ribbon domain-containing protein [Candidatus Cloacimonadota bacterium]